MGSIAASFLLLPNFATPASRVYACVVSSLPSVQDEYDNSDAIFSGKVIDIQTGNLGDNEELAVFFDVERHWKSPNENSKDYQDLVVFTATDSGLCGYSFEIGKSYLVYANMRDNGSLSTFAGTRTQLLEDATEDSLSLGEGRTPTINVSVRDQINDAGFQPIVRQEGYIDPTILLLVAGIGVAIASAIMLYYLYSRKRHRLASLK